MAWSLAEWATGSTAHLMSVPWDSSYKDVVWWSIEERNAYFHRQTTAEWTLDHMSYLKPGEPVAVPIPYDDCWQANYLVVENADMPDASHTPPVLCYFITETTYVAPNTTNLTLQLDIWQTFGLTMELGRCYVERGHVTMHAYDRRVRDVIAVGGTEESVFYQYAGRYLLEPDSLDLGNEYRVGRAHHKDLSTINDEGLGVIVVSTTDLTKDWGSQSSPNLDTATANTVDGLISGCAMYAFTGPNYMALTQKLSSAPWISKSIIMCIAVPMGIVQGVDVTIDGVSAQEVGGDQMVQASSLFTYEVLDEEKKAFSYFSDSVDVTRYRKLFTYPYSYITLSTFNGSPVLFKPECFGPVGLYFLVQSVVCPPHLRVAIYPMMYGTASMGINDEGRTYQYSIFGREGLQTAAMDYGQGLDCAVWLQSFPQFSLVNDEYLNYLVSTQNTRQASYAGAGWSLARSNAASELSYNQVETNQVNERQNQTLKNQQFNNQLTANGANAVVGAIGSLLGGNVFGAVSGLGSSVINNGAAFVNNQLSNQMFTNNQNTTLTLAGQNLGLAQWAAQGDYQQAIRTLNATVQDAALTQPSVSGQVGGEGFNVASGRMGVDLRVMVPSECATLAICDYWERYGYPTRRFIEVGRELTPMTRYTYWKMADTYLSKFDGDDSSRNVIRGILERGVTVWRDATDIGTVGLGSGNVSDMQVAAMY